jgi:hypothetical protein
MPHDLKLSRLFGGLVAKLQTISDIQKFMEKIISFLKKSNRYKHLVGGLIIGLLALGVYPALYAACVAGACLELKDKLHGCLWDWIDFLLTMCGGGLAALFWLIF